MAQKLFIVPYPGTGKARHLQVNIESAKLILTNEELKEIARARSEFRAHSGRVTEQQRKVVEQ